MLGFAPARRKKPIPVLDYRLVGKGSVTVAWLLTPHRGHRPEVRVTSEDRDGGTVVSVSHAGGSDSVYVAQRGETHAVTLGERPLRGRVAVVRRQRGGRNYR